MMTITDGIDRASICINLWPIMWHSLCCFHPGKHEMFRPTVYEHHLTIVGGKRSTAWRWCSGKSRFKNTHTGPVLVDFSVMTPLKLKGSYETLVPLTTLFFSSPSALQQQCIRPFSCIIAQLKSSPSPPKNNSLTLVSHGAVLDAQRACRPYHALPVTEARKQPHGTGARWD